MAARLFEEQEHAALYQKYRPTPPAEIRNLVLNYLQRKVATGDIIQSAVARHINQVNDGLLDRASNYMTFPMDNWQHHDGAGQMKGKPFGLAVDVGCGSGLSTRNLAPFFEKVVGIDVSGAQIEEAKKMGGLNNVSYRLGLAEELEFEDGSVDLVTAGTAAHWFDMEKFMKEVHRILKPKGCLALYCYRCPFELRYSACPEPLTQIVQEMFKALAPYESEKRQIVQNEYKEVFDAITFPDKERFDNIPFKRQVSISWVIGFIKSLSYYQTFQKKDPEAAKASLERMEQKLLQAMGVSSSETMLEMRLNAFCLLASKPE